MLGNRRILGSKNAVRLVPAALVCCALIGLPADRSLTEQEKIQGLLEAVEKSGVQFIRNGSAYPAKRARQHMELKLSKAGKRIRTAEHFIRYIATKSSFTGRPYLIREKDGKTVRSDAWLRATLARLIEEHRKRTAKQPARR